MPKTIKYIGTQVRWPEVAITGKQSTWSPGWLDERSDAEAAQLLATGLFIDWDARSIDEEKATAVSSLVSEAGNSYAINVLAPLSESQTAPVMLDDFQDHTLYTGASGTLSTVSATAWGGRVSLASPADSQTAMSVSRTIPYAVVPSKLGAIAIGVQQTGTKSSFGLKLGSDATVTQADSHSTPIRRQGLCWYAWHVSEFPTTYATTTQGTFTALLQTGFGATGHSGVTTIVHGAMYAGITPRPAVMFTFDDCYEETYTRAFPIMSSYGLVGSVFVVANDIGGAGRLTWAMLTEMANAGWSINVNATPDDSSMSTTPATAVAGLRVGQQALVDNGLARGGSEAIVCYSNNASTESVLQALSRVGVKLGRTTNPHGMFDLYGLGDQGLYFPSYSISRDTVFANVQARLDQGQLRGEAQMFHMHRVVDTAVAATEVPVALLHQVCSYSASTVRAGLRINPNTAQYVAMVGTRSALAIR